MPLNKTRVSGSIEVFQNISGSYRIIEKKISDNIRGGRHEVEDKEESFGDENSNSKDEDIVDDDVDDDDDGKLKQKPDREE